MDETSIGLKRLPVKRSLFDSLVFKTTFFVTVIMTLSLVVISLVFIVSEHKKISGDIVKNGETFASFSIRKIYDDYVQYYTHASKEDFTNFKALVQDTLKNNKDVENVSLIAINGRILFDSEEFAIGKATEDRTISDVQTVQMVKADKSSHRAIRLKNGEEVTEIVVPLPELGGGHVLSMRYLVSNRSLSVRMNEVYRQIITTIIPLLVFVLFTAVVYAIGFTAPIIQLTKGAEKIGEGNLNVRVENTSKDEIGMLASVFNQMTIKLKELYKDLKEKIVALTKAKEEISAGLLIQQQEKDRLSASINSFILGFIMINNDDHILDINQAALQILEIAPPVTNMEVIRDRLKDTCNLHLLHQQCFNEKKSINIKSVVLGAKFLHIMMTPILSKNREIEECIGTVLLIEDITEAKVLERSREEFFSIASHELRTPLTAIRGNASMIQDFYGEKLKDPELKEMVSDIHGASIRLIGIVNDFLDVSRLEQQRIEFKKELFDISILITDAIREYQVTGSRAKLSIQFDEPKTKLPLVFADKNRIRQVIINLVGNALKFTEVGGITLSASQTDDMVELSVTDTGRGIPPAFQGLLFHKFQQAGDSLITRDTTKGTGLGLYISKLLIEGMGGKIWLVKSEQGKGTTFAVSLPIASTMVE